MFIIGPFRFIASKPGDAPAGPFRGGEAAQEAEPTDIHLTAHERDGRVVGTVTLRLNDPRCPMKEGAISEFKLAPELHVPLQHALFPDGEQVPSVRACRKAAVVILGLFRALYWVSKNHRLTSWQISLSDVLTTFIIRAGISLQTLENGHYRVRVANTEKLLLNFKMLRLVFLKFLQSRTETEGVLEHLLSTGIIGPEPEWEDVPLTI